MSKFKSETTNLESRAQLVVHIGELTKRGIDSTAPAAQLVAGLKSGILALSMADRIVYFNEIGVSDPVNLDVWLTLSAEELEDPDAALDAALQAATSWQQVRNALVGRARHRGRP